MGRWASTIVIAGEDFSGCRGEIIGGSQFKSSVRGSIEWAANGIPHFQHIQIGVAGLKFGIQMASTQITKIESMVSAIETAMGLGQTFEVNLIDEMYNINVNAMVDFSANDWMPHQRVAQGYVESLQVLFVSHSQV